ncbi:MAG: GNAT family N-acetyltransferase [Actinomycetota bacterium]
MPTEHPLNIREANPQEDSLIAQHFYQMWQDNDIAAECMEPDWRKITLQFISHARQELGYRAFVAEVEGEVVGSVSCQLFAGLYPLAIATAYRQYGYIWGVYVEPAYRRQGIGKQLTHTAIAYLKAINCTRVLLHASPTGKPVYSSLGFSDSNEMRLDLV